MNWYVGWLVQYGQGSYVQKINRLADNKEGRLMVDLNELRTFKPDLANG